MNLRFSLLETLNVKALKAEEEEDKEEDELAEGLVLPREILGFWVLVEAEDMMRKEGKCKYKEDESKRLVQVVNEKWK